MQLRAIRSISNPFVIFCGFLCNNTKNQIIRSYTTTVGRRLTTIINISPCRYFID